jgi:serine/threonine-protein kinase RsbW
MTIDRHQMRIRARLEEIPLACEFVREAGIRAGLDEKAVHHCQLAVDEACTNIIEHGYGGDQPDQVIEVICSYAPPAFTIEIIDSGPAYDPLQHPPPDPNAELGERRIGGWGVFFIRKFMDDVAYQRRNNRNHLLMTKYLPHGRTANVAERSENQVTVIDVSEKVKVFVLSGRIDTAASRELEHSFAQHLNSGQRHFVLDMAAVEYISSAGLKMLVSVWKRTRDDKGDLVLAGLQPAMREVLRLLGFDLVFTIFDSADEAAARYRP